MKEVIKLKTTMSHPINDRWLESAYEAFGHALLYKDYKLAKDIVADTFDAGFDSAARAMQNELQRLGQNKICG